MASFKKTFNGLENTFEAFVFWSRWVQAPLYGGLAIGSFLYLVKFFQELLHLQHVLLIEGEAKIMLIVLSLVDISMVMNLVVMVTIGGYSIFTSKIDVDMHDDKPLWLDGLDAGMLKIKLATSLASISGVQLLKTFVDYRESAIGDKPEVISVVMEIGIHMVFILSALLLSVTEKTVHSYHAIGHKHKEGLEEE
ncbi:YqhA family protein [Reichenbachiella sp. MALMAid0571]|uniref:YqhA family protein n=1 Tax=Reichenbachiella sp. MALMAid0571 TaxID=3143939 RepID=UPI0032DE32D9